jgi:hypothetical protein
MSIEVHFLHSHLDLFPEILEVSDEQGELLDHDNKSTERRCPGFRKDFMMADVP